MTTSDTNCPHMERDFRILHWMGLKPGKPTPQGNATVEWTDREGNNLTTIVGGLVHWSPSMNENTWGESIVPELRARGVFDRFLDKLYELTDDAPGSAALLYALSAPLMRAEALIELMEDMES